MWGGEGGGEGSGGALGGAGGDEGGVGGEGADGEMEKPEYLMREAVREAIGDKRG
jgi:hypothetical protein